MASLESVTKKAGNLGNPPRLPNYTARARLDEPKQLNIQRVTSLTTLNASTNEPGSDEYAVVDDATSTSVAGAHFAANTASNSIDEIMPAPVMSRNTLVIRRHHKLMLAVVFIIALLLLVIGAVIFTINIRSSSSNTGTANANPSLKAAGNFRYEPVADPYETNPCLHSGTCVRHVAAYECRCTKPYRGRNCSELPLLSSRVVGDCCDAFDVEVWRYSDQELITSISVWLFYSANPYTSDGGPSITGVQATYGSGHNGTLYGRGVGHQLTINLQPNEFITQAALGFARIICKNKTVSGLCSLQFTINEGAVPGFNADANCSSQAYTRVSLGISLAYLDGSARFRDTNYISGLSFLFMEQSP